MPTAPRCSTRAIASPAIRSIVPASPSAMGVTLPDDYCFHCHQDIADDRPSHKGLAFTTCASAGCHKFHDNRALYADFLIKHAGEPDATRSAARDASSSSSRRKDGRSRSPKPLSAARRRRTGRASDRCRDRRRLGGRRACARRASTAPAATPRKMSLRAGSPRPASSHARAATTNQATTFTEGRHGMRLREGLFATHDGPLGLFKQTKLPPMTPAQARLPMKADAACQATRLQHLPLRAQIRPHRREGRGLRRLPRRRAHQGLFRLAALRPVEEGNRRRTAARQRRLVRHLPHAGRRRRATRTARRRSSSPTIRTTICARTKRWCAASCGQLPRAAVHARCARRSGARRQQFQGRPTVHVESIEWAQTTREGTRARQANRAHHPVNRGRRSTMRTQIAKLGAVALLGRLVTGCDRRLCAMVRQERAEGHSGAAGRRHAARGHGGRPHRLHHARGQSPAERGEGDQGGRAFRGQEGAAAAGADVPLRRREGGGKEQDLLLFAAVAVAGQQAERAAHRRPRRTA